MMINSRPQHTRNDLLPTMHLQTLAIADLQMPKNMVRKLDPGHIKEAADGIQAMGLWVIKVELCDGRRCSWEESGGSSRRLYGLRDWTDRGELIGGHGLVHQ